MQDGTVCVPLLSRSEIDAAIRRIAREVDRDYLGRDVVVIGILKG
jgi:hypoxanthine-guanine phosphoribosyltransferase